MHLNDIIGVTGILGQEALSILVPLVRHKGVQLNVITDQLDIPHYNGVFFHFSFTIYDSQYTA